MIGSVERRFGLVNQLPAPIEWLSDNGSPYTARETRRLARDIGLVPRTFRAIHLPNGPRYMCNGRSLRRDPLCRFLASPGNTITRLTTRPGRLRKHSISAPCSSSAASATCSCPE
jgi:transposase InsO family protein